MKKQLRAVFLSFAMRMLPEVSPTWAKQHINCCANVADWNNEHRHYVIWSPAPAFSWNKEMLSDVQLS